MEDKSKSHNGLIEPSMCSNRSSTVQCMSLVDREDDAECPGGPGAGVGFGTKLKDPASMR